MCVHWNVNDCVKEYYDHGDARFNSAARYLRYFIYNYSLNRLYTTRTKTSLLNLPAARFLSYVVAIHVAAFEKQSFVF